MTADSRTSTPGRPDVGPAPYADRHAAVRATVAGVLGAIAILPQALDKHRYAAHSLRGRIGGGVLIWLLVSALILGALIGVAWLMRELRRRGRTRLVTEPAPWLVSLAIGLALSGAHYAQRTHFSYRQVGPRITAAILLALIFALALRLLLALVALLLRADRPRDAFGT